MINRVLRRLALTLVVVFTLLKIAMLLLEMHKSTLRSDLPAGE